MKSQAWINQVQKHMLGEKKKKVTNINILNFYTNSKFSHGREGLRKRTNNY